MDEQQRDDTTPAGAREIGSVARSSIDLTVGIDRAWRSLVTDGGLGPWMGRGASIEAEVDGGLHLPDPVGGRSRRGRVERLENGQRLEFTWWPEDRPIERSLVSIVLEPIETGTRLTVTETVPRSISRSARASAVAPSPVGRSSLLRSPAAVPNLGVVGAWSWRLALLVLACNPVLV